MAVSYIANAYRCIYQCIIIINNNTIRIILEYSDLELMSIITSNIPIQSFKLVDFLNDS